MLCDTVGEGSKEVTDRIAHDLESRTARKFAEDLRNLAGELVKAHCLKYSQEVSHLSDPLLRWMDFTSRYIAPRPREVVLSSLFPKRLPDDISVALSRLVDRFDAGLDVNRFQSRGLTERNDVSSGRRQQRSDLLWADWGIHHLHLAADDALVGAGYSPRSDWLLFCKVLDDQVALVDVRRHGQSESFADPELVRQMFKDWPAFMSQFELRGILPARNQTDASKIRMLRNSGINGPLEHDGKVYMAPGGGVTSASTPTRLTTAADNICMRVRSLAKLVADPTGQIEQDLRARRVATRDFCMCITPQGVSVLEEQSLVAFTLPRSNGDRSNWLGYLHDQLLPTWVKLEAGFEVDAEHAGEARVNPVGAK